MFQTASLRTPIAVYLDTRCLLAALNCQQFPLPSRTAPQADVRWKIARLIDLDLAYPALLANLSTLSVANRIEF